MKHLPRRLDAAGFTLVELLIAITILAILVAMAVPAYHNYTIRAKIAECVNGATVPKVNISEYRQSLGAWPPSAAIAGLDASGDSTFCSGFANYDNATGAFEIDVDEAAIDALLFAAVSPRLTPSFTASGMVDWNCTRGTTPVGLIKYLPSTCRDASP